MQITLFIIAFSAISLSLFLYFRERKALEAERRALEQAKCRAREAEQKAQEAERRVEEAERKAQKEVERSAWEEAARREVERRAQEEIARLEAARCEAERKAQEGAERWEKHKIEIERWAERKIEMERKAREKAERWAREETARREAEHRAAQKAEYRERNKLDSASDSINLILYDDSLSGAAIGSGKSQAPGECLKAKESKWEREHKALEAEKRAREAEHRALEAERRLLETEHRLLEAEHKALDMKRKTLELERKEYGRNNLPFPFDVDKVEFSAVTPGGFVRGEPSIVRLFLYAADFREEVNQIICAEQEPTKETKSGAFRIAKNAKVKVDLSAPAIDFYHLSEEREWIGEYIQYTVPVVLPDTYRKGHIQFYANVYVEGVCRICLAFIAHCVHLQTQRMKITRRDVHSAFISYARENIAEVTGRIQGIQKGNPDLKLFFDKDSLRSGEQWESKLKQEIEQRDILYLFWSKAASESEWVEKEWRYALELKGLDGIDPFPLETIPPCPSPPDELKSLHFQDKWLYFQ